MSGTNSSPASVSIVAVQSSTTAVEDAAETQPKSSNLDATIGCVAAKISEDIEEQPLKIVSRENSPATQVQKIPAKKPASPQPPPLRRTPAAPPCVSVAPPPTYPNAAPPHGFLIGSPPAAAAAASYGFLAAAAAQQMQQQHAAILLNSCPPLTFVAPPPPIFSTTPASTHRSAASPQGQTPRPQPPQLNFPPTSILFCRMPGAPMHNVGFGPYAGATYPDPSTLMAANQWNGHFLVRTATGQLMALAVNNTPAPPATVPAPQRAALPPSTPAAPAFLPQVVNSETTPRLTSTLQSTVNRTPSKTPTSTIFPSQVSTNRQPPSATPILQKTLILPPKEQSRSDVTATQPQTQPPAPIIIGCGPPAIYHQPQPAAASSDATKTQAPQAKRRRSTTTVNAAAAKKPRRIAAAAGLLITAQPKTTTTLQQPQVNFKDKKIKQEIHDMFVDQIRNDCSLMFDAPQIMTHYVDGFVIQESLDPFPISPLIFDDLPPFIQQSAAAAAAAGLSSFDWAAPPRLTPEFGVATITSSSSATTTMAQSSSSSTSSSSVATTTFGQNSPTIGAKSLTSPTNEKQRSRRPSSNNFPLISPKKEAPSPLKSPFFPSSSTLATCRGCSKKLTSTSPVGHWFRKNAQFCSKLCYKSTKKGSRRASDGKKKRRRSKNSPPTMNGQLKNLMDERTTIRPVSVPSDSLSPQRRYSTETPAIHHQQSSDFPSTSSSSATTTIFNNPSPAILQNVSTSFLEKSPVDWTVDDVQNWLLSLDQKFLDLCPIFRQQEIDGQALLLLQEDHLAHQMCLKLGPVLKISAALKMLRN